jgi:cysteine desulfurase
VTRTLYLDYAASTPIDERVVSAMAPYHGAANPSSAHGAGRDAAEAVEQARRQVAALLGASVGEIVFTSGATEADNLAIGGAIQAAGGGHVVTTAAEHKAVLETVRSWCPTATVVPVSPDGSVDPSSIAAAIRPETVLVSVMVANNEVGTLSPIDEIGAVCRARNVLFHTDAAQAVGKIPIDVGSLPIDLLSVSAHKMYGPQGVGALWIRRAARSRVRPLMLGGGHERGLRAGTTNVAGCVGFGEAASLLQDEAAADESHSRKLRARLVAGLLEAFEGAQVNGHPSRCVPGILNVRLPGVDAESLLLATPRVAASTGSACTSAVPEPSHVLLAMGLSHEAALESMRLSFGRFTGPEEIDEAIETLLASADLIRVPAATESRA